MQIPTEYENIKIEAIAEDEKNAKVEIKGATYLLEGQNEVKITVTSASKEKREYIIHVLRTPESNNLIKTLTVSSGDIYELSPKFSPGINDYQVRVGSEISRITIEAVAEEETTQITGTGEYDLKVGMNKYVIESTSKEGQTRSYTVTVIRESSKNVYLKKLEIKNGQMKEEFEKEKGLYEVEIKNDVNELEMEIETEDENASYKVIGNENLIAGETIVRIRVESSDKTAAKTYTLKVEKEGKNNNYLKEIRIDGEQIENFDKEKIEYEKEVENEINKIKIEGIKEDETSKVEGNGEYALKEGENIVNLIVTSEKGEIRTYQVKIKRKYNDYLQGIVTDRGEVSPEFDKKINEYRITVGKEIKDITVIGIKEAKEATVIGNGKYELETGENEIILTVRNQNEREYKIKVTKEGSYNNNLEYLIVGEGELNPEFSKEKTEYEVRIPNEKTKLTLDYKAEDEKSRIEEIGNENLEDGSKVQIKVISETGEEKIYEITVRKEEQEEYSNYLKSIIVSEGKLNPEFSKENSYYKVEVGNKIEKIKVSGVRESIDSVVEGFGEYTLKEGINEIKIKVISKDKKERIYTLKVERAYKNEARLKELEINEGELSPSFNKNEYSYEVETEEEMLTIKKVSAVDEEASIEEIREGTTLKIKVTSKDKTEEKIYEVRIKRREAKAELENIEISKGALNPEYNKKIKVYEVKVENEVKSIEIKGIAKETVTVIGNGVYELKTGENVINLTVTTETGETNIYSVKVTREKNNNNNLKSLYIRGKELNPEFDKGITEYEVEVENEEEEIKIEGEKEEESAKVEGLGEYKIEEGENIVNIIVTAENGDIKIYKVKVIRKEKESADIKSLEIKEGILSPEFNKEITEYEVRIPNEKTSITEIVELEDEKARYEIIGKENLKEGQNEVIIKVISRSGKEKEYKITVIREKETNNYIKEIILNKGELKPSFDKEVQNYEVELENEEEEIEIKAVGEVESTKVIGNGVYTLKTGENEVNIIGESETGIQRVYKIKVIRKKERNNYLKSLRVNKGELRPEFNKEINSYEVEAEIGQEEIEVEGIAESIKGVVNGNGVYKLEVGTKKIQIEVTSESGEVNIYEIDVKRKADTNLGIKNITVSEGELSPSFDKDENTYEINVGKNTNIININVELESKTAKVSGNENIMITDTEMTKEVIITAEDGSTRTLTFKIIKESEVEEIEVKEEEKIIGIDEKYQIEAKVLPETVKNKEKIYESKNEEIAEVTESGEVIGKKQGETKIIVKSKENPNKTKEIRIKVVLKEIRTKKYEIKEIEDGKILIGMEVGTTIEEIKESLENDENTIKIYEEGKEIEGTEKVKTGQEIKLEIEGTIYDEAKIVLRGDINGDGMVSANDYEKIISHILNKEIITGYKTYAADITQDGAISTSDYEQIMQYFLDKITTLN